MDKYEEPLDHELEMVLRLTYNRVTHFINRASQGIEHKNMRHVREMLDAARNEMATLEGLSLLTDLSAKQRAEAMAREPRPYYMPARMLPV